MIQILLQRQGRWKVVILVVPTIHVGISEIATTPRPGHTNTPDPIPTQTPDEAPKGKNYLVV